MKQIVLTIVTALALTNNSFAEVRSTFEKIYASDYMPVEQTIDFELQPEKPVHLKSRFSGVRLQTENRRSIVNIESEEDLSDLPEPLIKQIRKAIANKPLTHFHIFANFAHVSNLNPKVSEYYIGILAKTASVKKVMLEKAYTPSGIPTDIALNLKLSENLTIIPQESDLFPIMHLKRPTLSYAMERVGDENSGNTFDLLDALTGRYAYALSLSSLESRQLSSLSKGSTKEEVVDGLSQEQKKQVFLNCLKESNRIQEMGIYHFLYNNSVVHSLNIIKSVTAQTDDSEKKANPTVLNHYFSNDEAGMNGQSADGLTHSSLMFIETVERISQLLHTSDDFVSKIFSQADRSRSPSENFVRISGAQKLIEFLQRNGFSTTEIENFARNAAEFERQPL